jgi:hypothetical protein
MVSISEFLHPLAKSPLREKALAALYFAHRYNFDDALNVEQIRGLLQRAQVPRIRNANLADVMAKSAPYVETAGKDGVRFLWRLTQSGDAHVRTALGLPEADPEIEHDVSTLRRLAEHISEPDVAAYVSESITCLSVGALRAAVVFLWAGAVRRIHGAVMGEHLNAVNAAFSKYDPNARAVKRIDDLSYFKESTLLLVAQELGILDKNERGILESSLDLRNKCGHPGKYSPGPKKASSFIEDVVGIVFR